jgi:hypothetical protein
MVVSRRFPVTTMWSYRYDGSSHTNRPTRIVYDQIIAGFEDYQSSYYSMYYWVSTFDIPPGISTLAKTLSNVTLTITVRRLQGGHTGRVYFKLYTNMNYNGSWYIGSGSVLDLEGFARGQTKSVSSWGASFNVVEDILNGTQTQLHFDSEYLGYFDNLYFTVTGTLK